MQSMTDITRIAARRKGGASALEKLLTKPSSKQKLRKIPADRWLSAITKCVFQAGFKWQIIEDKWEMFESVFDGFDVDHWLMMSEEDLDRLLKTDGIVKNVAKLRSVGRNAMFLRDVIDQYGSVGGYFAQWGVRDYSNNLRELHKKGARLGGKTGQIFLRRMGVDTMVFTTDVLKALGREGVIDRIPASNRDWDGLQLAIDTWCDGSGRSLTEVSQILAFSVD